MRLLLAEDDHKLAAQLLPGLKAAGYAIDHAANGHDALFYGETMDYDAIILDRGLPGLSGDEVLLRWRQQKLRTPVLILTARDSWRDKVDGLKAGADDYLTKPFHTEELLARLTALIRRAHGTVVNQLRAGNFCLDEEYQKIIYDDQTTTELTATEFRLLRYFMLNAEKPLSKTRLTEHLYDQDFDHDSNLIEVYVRRLRDKIGRQHIETRRYQGYVFHV